MNPAPVICAIDLETTGLDFDKDYILEVGWVIKQWGCERSLAMQDSYIRLPEGVEIPSEIFDLTGINKDMGVLYGTGLRDCLSILQHACKRCGVEYIVTHNGTRFDWPFLMKMFVRDQLPTLDLFALPRLDTITDISYPTKCRSLNLTYLAAFHGFLNPFPHSALFDAFTTLRILDEYQIEDTVARSKVPWVVLRAMVLPPFRDPKPPGLKESDIAKKLGFRWQDCGDGKEYDKCWVKRVKENEIEREAKACPFEVKRISNETK